MMEERYPSCVSIGCLDQVSVLSYIIGGLHPHVSQNPTKPKYIPPFTYSGVGCLYKLLCRVFARIDLKFLADCSYCRGVLSPKQVFIRKKFPTLQTVRFYFVMSYFYPIIRRVVFSTS